jgi:hypothetical protein
VVIVLVADTGQLLSAEVTLSVAVGELPAYFIQGLFTFDEVGVAEELNVQSYIVPEG